MPTNSEAQDLYEELHALLDDAYWASSDGNHRDLIQGVKSAIFKEMRALRQQELQDRTAAYQRIAIDQQRLKKRLDNLVEDIDDMIAKVDLASDIVNVIDDVIVKLL